MNKNWNDRADKDLFFTILSVKNIGVISGAEWTTIGNHMRSLGYGFTNEGCRQHFQGLRRAQHKAESNGDSQRRSDPTENPITRRPGPGRGRPRKQPPAPIAGSDQVHSSKPSSEAHEADLDDDAAPMDAIPVEETDSLGLAQDDSALDEEQPSKRQRLENDDQTDDDAAVLALAADGLPGPDDHYGPPEYYGEA
ncbi:uncharacterized protein F4807DRAFT_421936 [Annulohypoxylon truncatum]|uniref:uncharacterized protein n=1 Tax=Annulohypoxylon truncatum TaxID=327061 RepID=UPI0020085ABF|nr:uncharacterized protein F4807DRAFT_421936 [Annulohypoxylon truncatum]KAI1210584.1 hypothetical protein F4807DRAFT_421936 [Annulohypoxylon truncatum]